MDRASERWIIRLLRWGALAVALSGVFYVAYGLSDLKQTLERITTMADQPSELHATWLGTDGITHEVITYKRAGETNGDFATRHAGEVAAMLVVFPKAP